MKINNSSTAKVAKFAASAFVGLGSSVIARSAIATLVDPQDTITKIEVDVASVVIGAAVADIMHKYTSAKIDELVAFANEAFGRNETVAPTYIPR